MEQIEWDEKFNIGVEVVDKAHAKLFRIFKKLMEISKDSGTSHHSYQEGIKYLETYSMTHFSEEEAYMRSIRYKGYAEHKRIHDSFRDKTLVSLKKDLELSNYSPAAVQRFVGVISNWVAEHIMKEDQAIVGKHISRKSQDPSSLIPIISRAVNRNMVELFQVEAKLASAEYKGQNIGAGKYCHQTYDVDGGIKLQLLMGVEDPLLLRGIQHVSTTRLQTTNITSDSSLKVFVPLFENMGKLFRAQEEEPLGKDNLLDTDQFRAEFMKGYVCCLLFSTKIGYFIFCYRSWRVKAKPVTTSAAGESTKK